MRMRPKTSAESEKPRARGRCPRVAQSARIWQNLSGPDSVRSASHRHTFDRDPARTRSHRAPKESTAPFFRLTPPSDDEVRRFIANQKHAELSYSEVGASAGT